MPSSAAGTLAASIKHGTHLNARMNHTCLRASRNAGVQRRRLVEGRLLLALAAFVVGLLVPHSVHTQKDSVDTDWPSTQSTPCNLAWHCRHCWCVCYALHGWLDLRLHRKMSWAGCHCFVLGIVRDACYNMCVGQSRGQHRRHGRILSRLFPMAELVIMASTRGCRYQGKVGKREPRAGDAMTMPRPRSSGSGGGLVYLDGLFRSIGPGLVLVSSSSRCTDWCGAPPA